ncbi:MAG: M20 family metallopeptidase [Bacteroidales bacterium]|nr:M20 family metallopeptidase [Bacteroidales bacterium]MDD4209421.1 M20 family metallopeptidase [Bacteroidales bacterium]
MNTIIEQIKHLSSTYFLETIKLRRLIHQYPELSEHEFITARYICNTLKSYGIKSELLLNNTAVIASIEGNGSSKAVLGLRAETDALPIEEKSDNSYISTNKGIMHACGHDAHTASLLTTARILELLKDQWGGSIKLFFQPSEEKYPGGAIRMIEAGVLENPKVDMMLAMHVSPEIETGKIGIKADKFMASTDEIYVNIKGKGGHAALTHSYVNPIYIAANSITELDTLFKASAPEEFPSVLTFGRFIGEGKTNIVPDETLLEGTLRTFDEEWRKNAHKLIKKTFTKIAKEHKGEAIVRIVNGYPVLINNPEVTSLCESYAKEFLGSGNVLPLHYRMTSDDFASFSNVVPSLMYRLGVKIEDKELNLHAANFDINEKVLEFSPGLMAFMALNLLNTIKKNE